MTLIALILSILCLLVNDEMMLQILQMSLVVVIFGLVMRVFKIKRLDQ